MSGLAVFIAIPSSPQSLLMDMDAVCRDLNKLLALRMSLKNRPSRGEARSLPRQLGGTRGGKLTEKSSCQGERASPPRLPELGVRASPLE